MFSCGMPVLRHAQKCCGQFSVVDQIEWYTIRLMTSVILEALRKARNLTLQSRAMPQKSRLWRVKLQRWTTFRIASQSGNVSNNTIRAQRFTENTIFVFGGLLANVETLSTWRQFPQECPRMRYSGRNCHVRQRTGGIDSNDVPSDVMDSRRRLRFAVPLITRG